MNPRIRSFALVAAFAATALIGCVPAASAAPDPLNKYGETKVDPTIPGDWDFVSPASGTITNSTTAVTIAAAPTDLNRANFLAQIVVNSDALGAATELAFRNPALTCASQTIASNTLVLPASHGLLVGDSVVFSTSGVTGITAGTTYYVLTVSGNSATFSATPGGTVLTISGTGVTPVLNHYLLRLKLSTAGLIAPVNVAFKAPLKGSVGKPIEVVTLTASSTGAVFVNAQGFVR